MKHRHTTGPVRYRTKRGRIMLRKRPIHNLSRPKARFKAWTLFHDKGVDEIDPDYLTKEDRAAGMLRVEDGVVLDTYDRELSKSEQQELNDIEKNRRVREMLEPTPIKSARDLPIRYEGF